jgi:hypothetical protein
MRLICYETPPPPEVIRSFYERVATLVHFLLVNQSPTANQLSIFTGMVIWITGPTIEPPATADELRQ